MDNNQTYSLTPRQNQMPMPYADVTWQDHEMYPEIYHDVYPLIADAVNRLVAAGITPTPETISMVVDNIIRNSGMWYEDEDDDYMDQNLEAVPAQYGFGNSPYRRRRRRYHNRNTLRDIVRILLLNELGNRGHGHYSGY